MGARLVKESKVLILVLISLAIIGAVTLTDFISFSGIKFSIISQVEESQQIKTEYSASQIENHINQIRDELTTLSKFPLMKTLDLNKCSGNMEIVHQSIQGKINSLLRADKSGNVIECSSPDF